VLTDRGKKILTVFDEYIFGFMRGDINAAIDRGAYYLAALGLVSYTEVLGGLLTSNLGVERTSRKNFKAFLPYLGEGYVALEKKGIDVYGDVRCGLVHNYFIKTDSLKGASTIWEADPKSSSPGIVASSKGPTSFYVNIYARDFFEGATRFRNEILEGKDPSLATNFEKGMKQIYVWK
jgi:hypothetical protein